MNMDKETYTSPEQEHLEREEVIVNDYYARQSAPTIDVDEELAHFKRKHCIQPSFTMRNLTLAIASLAAITLLLFTLFKVSDSDKPSRQAAKSAMPLVAYHAVKSRQKEVVIRDADGNARVVGQERLTVKSSMPQTTIATHTLTTPAGKTIEVELADGTIVWLNANSKLTFPDKFDGKERKVSVEGEAYFKVTHNADQPFVVSTGKMNTTVLGTEFDVNSNCHNFSCVTLVKGSVEVSDPQGKCYQKIVPGENATLKGDATFAVKTVDTNVYCAWKDGNFYFDNSTLWDIAQELGRWYNVSVVFNNPRLISTRIFLTASRHASIEEIIEIINNLNKARFSLRNGQIIIN